MTAKVLKFPTLPRVPIPRPTIPHKDNGDEARVNTKVSIRKEIEEEGG